MAQIHEFMEELLRSSSSLMYTCMALMVVLFLIVKREKSRGNRSKLPPGPWNLPIIGSSHHLVGSLLHHTLRDLALKYGSLMYLQLGQVPTIVVSNEKYAKAILKTHDSVFGTRAFSLASYTLTYGAKDMVFSPTGPYWREIRKICVMELLSAKKVMSFASIRQEEISELVRFISSTAPAPVNLSHKLLELSNDITGRASFRKKCKEQEGFLEAMKEQMELLGGFSVSDFLPSLAVLDTVRKSKLVNSHRKLDRIFDEIVEEHRRDGDNDRDASYNEDLVDVLLRVQKDADQDSPLSNESVKAVIWDMFVGGTESSSTVMEWAMSELVHNPRVMEKAQKEVREVLQGKSEVDDHDLNKLSYLKLVIKESLRLHPPATMLAPREAIETCTVDGYEIPAKTRVLINVWAIARDPKHWENPETFDPERFSDGLVDFKGTDFQILPFGAGRRICPGLTFGMATVELALAKLLFYFDWKLPNGLKPEDLDMSEAFGLSTTRKSSLNLIAIPRFPIPVRK